MASSPSLARHWPDVRQRILIVLGICAVMIVVHVLGWLIVPIRGLGIHPRSLPAVWTVLTAPFVHGDLAHLGNNLVGFALLASLCLIRGVRHFVLASLIIIGLGGGLVWLLGRDANHIGASGWIFGLWSLVIVQAWFDRSPRTIAISIGVVLLYGGMAWGVLPTQSGVSFESHLFGALAGGVAAWLLRGTVTPLAVPPPGVPEFWA